MFGIVKTEKKATYNESTKICSKCGLELPIENFGRSSGAKYRRTECNSCNRELVRVRNAGDLDMEETPEATDNTSEKSEAILEQPYDDTNNEHMYGPKLIGNLLGDLAKVARKNEFAASVPAAKAVETINDSSKSPIGS